MATRFLIDDVEEQRNRLASISARNEARADRRMAEEPGFDLNRRPMMRVREDIPARPGVDSYEVSGDDTQRVLNPDGAAYRDDGMGAYRTIRDSRRRMMTDATMPSVRHEYDLASGRGQMGSADSMFRQNAGGTNQEQVRRKMDAGGYLDQIRRARQLADTGARYENEQTLGGMQRDAMVDSAEAAAAGKRYEAQQALEAERIRAASPKASGNSFLVQNGNGTWDRMADPPKQTGPAPLPAGQNRTFTQGGVNFIWDPEIGGYRGTALENKETVNEMMGTTEKTGFAGAEDAPNSPTAVRGPDGQWREPPAPGAQIGDDGRWYRINPETGKRQYWQQ